MTPESGHCSRVVDVPDDMPIAAGRFELGPAHRDVLHRHGCHQVSFADHDDARLVLEGHTSSVNAHTAMIVPGGTRHLFASDRGGRHIHCFYFKAAIPVSSPQAVELSPLARELMRELLREDVAEPSRRLMTACLYDQIGSLLRCTLVNGRSLSEPLEAACRRVLDDPAVHESMTDIARSVLVSERTLRRLAHAELGCSLGQFRTRCRVFNALRLVQTGQPIKRVAHDVGFVSESAFFAAFKAVMGKTPNQFRQALGRVDGASVTASF